MEYGVANLDHARATELFSAYWDEELPPEDLSARVRLLRASLIHWREHSLRVAIALAAGFSGPQGLHRAANGVLQRQWQ